MAWLAQFFSVSLGLVPWHSGRKATWVGRGRGAAGDCPGVLDQREAEQYQKKKKHLRKTFLAAPNEESQQKSKENSPFLSLSLQRRTRRALLPTQRHLHSYLCVLNTVPQTFHCISFSPSPLCCRT